MVEGQEIIDPPSAYAGFPPYIGGIPGEIGISPFPQPGKLGETAEIYLENNPKLRKWAERTGKDIIANVTGNRNVLIVGAGVAAISLIVGAIVIYRHKKGDQLSQSPDADS